MVSRFFSLDFEVLLSVHFPHEEKHGAPRKSADTAKAELIQFRVNAAEKRTFSAAADLDGKNLANGCVTASVVCLGRSLKTPADRSHFWPIDDSRRAHCIV